MMLFILYVKWVVVTGPNHKQRTELFSKVRSSVVLCEFIPLTGKIPSSLDFLISFNTHGFIQLGLTRIIIIQRLDIIGLGLGQC